MKYILTGICVVLFSCNSGKYENYTMNRFTVDILTDTWILDNQYLKSILSDYVDQVKDGLGKEDIIVIDYKAINDSTCRYTLSVGFDISSFLDDPPHVLFRFEQLLICLYIDGLNINIFKMNEEFLAELMKKNFPDQYNYYLKFGTFQMSATGGSLVWELVFQNDRLLSKDEYFTQ